MAEFLDFFDEVRAHVPKAPMPEIEAAIRRAVIKFCRDSHIWREWHTLALKPDVKEHRIRARGGRVEAIRSAMYEDNEVKRIELTQAQWALVIHPERETYSRPRNYALSPDHERVAFSPVPDELPELKPVAHLYLILVPERSSRSFPDSIAEEWQESIIHGALFYLYRTPNKPWSSQNRAATERFEFYTDINRATRESHTDNWAPTMTRMRQWV